MGDGGKGSRPRPFSVSQEEFDGRWDTIFKKQKSVATEESNDDVVAKEDLDDPDRIGN